MMKMQILVVPKVTRIKELRAKIIILAVEEKPTLLTTVELSRSILQDLNVIT